MRGTEEREKDVIREKGKRAMETTFTSMKLVDHGRQRVGNYKNNYRYQDHFFTSHFLSLLP